MEWKQSNYSDIDRYYRGTIIKLRDFGDKLFRVTRVESDVVVLVDAEGTKDYTINLHDDYPFVVDMQLPHKTLFQAGKYAFLMERIPAKQYYRGISTTNTKISKLGVSATWEMVPLGFDSLAGYVNKPTFPTFNEYMDKTTLVSAALSPRWAVVRTGYIFVDNQPVGTFGQNPKTKEYTFVVKGILIPELQDLFKQTGVTNARITSC